MQQQCNSQVILIILFTLIPQGSLFIKILLLPSWSNGPLASKSLSALHRSEAVVVMALIGAALGATALFSSLAKTLNVTGGLLVVCSCFLVSFKQWFLADCMPHYPR